MSYIKLIRLYVLLNILCLFEFFFVFFLSNYSKIVFMLLKFKCNSINFYCSKILFLSHWLQYINKRNHLWFFVVVIVSVGEPCRVARKVMEKSPHSFLVGEGAEAFAREHGFTIEPNKDMLSTHTAAAYQVLTHNVSCNVCCSLG